MNGLRLIRGLFKKSREKISRREGLIGVGDKYNIIILMKDVGSQSLHPFLMRKYGLNVIMKADWRCLKDM